MKFLIIITLTLFLHACNFKNKQNVKKEITMHKNQQIDSLILKKYVGGDPFINRIDTEIKVAKNWGFIIEYTYGDCGGTYDHLIKEFKTHNKQVLRSLQNDFGRNWQVNFEIQVLLNMIPWYFNADDFDGLLKKNTLKLTNQKNKASLTFNSDNTGVLTFKMGKKNKHIIAFSYHMFENILFLNLPNRKNSLNYKIKSIKSNGIIMNRYRIFTRSYK